MLIPIVGSASVNGRLRPRPQSRPTIAHAETVPALRLHGVTLLSLRSRRRPPTSRPGGRSGAEDYPRIGPPGCLPGARQGDPRPGTGRLAAARRGDPGAGRHDRPPAHERGRRRGERGQQSIGPGSRGSGPPREGPAGRISARPARGRSLVGRIIPPAVACGSRRDLRGRATGATGGCSRRCGECLLCQPWV